MARKITHCVFVLGVLGTIITLLPSSALARDLQGRFGLGYNNQFVNQVPAMSLRYGLTRDIAGQLIVGANTRSPSSTTFGLKFSKILFFETNLNFYAMLGAGLVQAQSQSGTEFLGGFGAEFFIPGLESLGLSVETGGSLNNVTSGYAFRTLGLSFIDAGIHFYF